MLGNTGSGALRRSSLSVVAVTVLSACGPASSIDHERTTRTSGAITDGNDDIQDLAHANIVVRIGDDPNNGICGGTLLTPSVVLTAGHCVYGFLHNIAGTKPVISYGIGTAVADAHAATTGSPDVLLTLDTGGTGGANLPVSEVPNDLAIYYMDTSSLDADFASAVASGNPAGAAWRLLLETERGDRASLQAPPLGSTQQVQIPVGIAGYSPFQGSRQVKFFNSGEVVASSAINQAPPTGAWFHGPSDVTPGDSGGPMFRVRSDGTREVFGVASASLIVEGEFLAGDLWADITSPANSAWIRSHLVDHSHDGPDQANWRRLHPGYLWKGEVEYTGPCRPEDDADCDHWTDEHDNCPFVLNPEQTDTDDDGVGDACPLCPCDPGNDVDKDLACGGCSPVNNGFCSAFCGTAPALDNCPFVANGDQNNCNFDAEIARGATVLGDACDPVPCPSSGTPLASTPCSGEPNIAEQCVGRQIRSQLHTVTIGSHVSEALVESAHRPGVKTRPSLSLGRRPSSTSPRLLPTPAFVRRTSAPAHRSTAISALR